MPLDSSTAITIGGIEAWDEGTTETYGVDGQNEATRELVCVWEDRKELVAYILGGSTLAGVIVSGDEAMQYPDATHMRARTVRVTGEGIKSVGTNGMVAYQWARLSVNHQPPEGNSWLEDEVGSVALDFAVSTLALPSDEPTYKWEGSGEAVPASQTTGKRIVTVGLFYDIQDLPTLPVSTIIAAADSVNSTSFKGAAAGWCLFEGARSRARILATGVENWSLGLAFSVRSADSPGWNQLLNPTTGNYENIVTRIGSNPPHHSYNHNDLLSGLS
jgi:hypothetical protein